MFDFVVVESAVSLPYFSVDEVTGFVERSEGTHLHPFSLPAAALDDELPAGQIAIKIEVECFRLDPWTALDTHVEIVLADWDTIP
ncbi:MAG: hypothetical protein WD757_06060 [Actinomycetota bacterium]